MRNVYICLPFEEDVKGNSEKAKRYAKYAFECGMAPVMPHFYVEIVENQSKENIKAMVDSGMSLLWEADECWVFGEELTEKMKKEIRFAQKLNIDILYFTENEKGEICGAKKKKAKKRR